MLTIVGGVYYETCVQPFWSEVFGSAGRAANAVARMGIRARLISYADSRVEQVVGAQAVLEGFEFEPHRVGQSVGFEYVHGLSTPYIRRPRDTNQTLEVSGDKVLYFGMIDGEAVIECDYAVYDPQNFQNPRHFHENGSRANHLALVLNTHEARTLAAVPALEGEDLVRRLVEQSSAEVVVLKQGPMGALVYSGSTFTRVAALKTSRVWKIGSGDVFVSHFANNWMLRGMGPTDAANEASRATAFYCDMGGLPDQTNLGASTYEPITAQGRQGRKPKVYLAGPFFTLAQRWQIEQARSNLLSMGLDVFSPFHDVGRGPAEEVVQKDLRGVEQCDLIFAIGDGLDAGTIYEVGYARALEKPVIFYSESVSEEDLKMITGSGCITCNDYVSAIYQTVWKAISL